MKICVSIAPTSMEEAFRMLNNASKYSDLVELRIDDIYDLNLERLLQKPRPKLIITNRKEKEGGKFTGSVRKGIEILTKAMSLGAEFIDIEGSCGTNTIQKFISQATQTRVICSYHNFKSTPPNLLNIYNKLCKTGAPIIKIATMANNITDNEIIFRLLHQTRRDRQKIIAFCMGEFGQMSRILTGKYGGFLTYGSLGEDSYTAPGQIAIQDLKNIYRLHTLRYNTKVFGLVGNPVNHSQGIYYHNNQFSQASADAVYINFLVTDLGNFLRSFRNYFSGLSITMPFKQDIVLHLDSLNEEAKQLRVVNTVIKNNDELIGYNTDLPAIITLIRKKTKMEGKRVVVLGSGATAKTMAFAATLNGATTTLVGRTEEKVKSLAEELHCEWATLSDITGITPDILMNATPLGMEKENVFTLLPKSYFQQNMLIFDAAYGKEETPIIRHAKAVGCKTISGLEFFYQQASFQSRLFFQTLI